MGTAIGRPTEDGPSIQHGADGARLFREKVDCLFEIIDDADLHTGGLCSSRSFAPFRGIDASMAFGLYDGTHLIDLDTVDDSGKPTTWPIDVGAAAGADQFSWDCDLQLTRHQSVDLKTVRGKVRVFSKYMLRNDILAVVREQGQRKLIIKTFYLALINRRWVDVTMHTRWQGVIGEGRPAAHADSEPGRTAERAAMMIGLAAVAHYQWHVEIGRIGGISFKFPTMPERLAEIFRLRDLPDGASRRAALKNWITSHWRANHRDQQTEIYVRQHLRGAETFSWDGYFVTVCPSQYDLDLNENFAAERKLMGRQAIRPKNLGAFEKPRIRVKALTRPVPADAITEW